MDKVTYVFTHVPTYGTLEDIKMATRELEKGRVA